MPGAFAIPSRAGQREENLKMRRPPPIRRWIPAFMFTHTPLICIHEYIGTDIEIGADGSVRLLSPLPAWLNPGRAHVLLTVETEQELPKHQKVTAKPDFLARQQALFGSRVLPDSQAILDELRADRF